VSFHIFCVCHNPAATRAPTCRNGAKKFIFTAKYTRDLGSPRRRRPIFSMGPTTLRALQQQYRVASSLDVALETF
jgi:hypothetical protein